MCSCCVSKVSEHQFNGAHKCPHLKIQNRKYKRGHQNIIRVQHLSVVNTHLCFLFSWLFSRDLICLWFLLLLLLLFLLGECSLQLVVQKVFEGVQVSLSFVLFCL